MTQQSYAAVDQLGQLLAQEASRLLPGHPPVTSNLSYSTDQRDHPRQHRHAAARRRRDRAPRPGTPRLYLFFATWDQQITGLAGQLEALDRYARLRQRGGLPALTAVDEASVEPSPAALTRLPGDLPRPLAYPVAIDRSGRVADGYEVQGQPWFVLTSPTGRILWYWEVATSAGRARPASIAHVRDALARAPAPRRAPRANSSSRVHPRRSRRCTGKPAACSARHRPSRPGSEALRGYPIVINAWASWCAPCRSEFGLFATASARYGRRVAFLGADTNDSAGDARAFLTQHPVSYPSYQTSTSGLTHSRRRASPAYQRRSSSTAPARSPTSTPANTTRKARSTATSRPTRSEGEPAGDRSPLGGASPPRSCAHARWGSAAQPTATPPATCCSARACSTHTAPPSRRPSRARLTPRLPPPLAPTSRSRSL